MAFGAVFDLATSKKEIAKLEKEVLSPDFWSDQDRAQKISKKLGALKEEVEKFQEIKKESKEILELAKIADQENDESIIPELEKRFSKLEEEFQKLEFFVLFKNKYDKNNAIITIHAGAGGVDAQDWAEMLLRMYLRFCEKKNFNTRILDESRGDEAGVKSVTFIVEGAYAYGFLKKEAGVHRLVRISPFDAEKMRHTSFALVEVLPELEEPEVKIKDDDLRVDTFLSSGHGGQSVQTTYSAVRLTHIPTGIVVSCQNERSQKQNKETAMKILHSRLMKFYESQAEKEKQKLRGKVLSPEWGNQIRSYVLHPYKLVRDERTGFKTDKVEEVLAGDLDELIRQSL